MSKCRVWTTALRLVVAGALLGGLVTTPVHAAQRRDEPPWTLSVREFLLATNEPGAVNGSLVVSGDARHAAYITTSAGGKQVVWNAMRGAPYDDVGPIVFSPDAMRLAYPAKTDGRWFMVL